MTERRGTQFTVKKPAFCFGCGPENPIGCQLKVDWDGERATAQFTPTRFHTGLDNVVHGGILCTLLDEVMSYVPYGQGLVTVTGKMQARFCRPAHPGETLTITARLTRRNRKLMETEATITLANGTLVAEGTALMVIQAQGKTA